MILRKTKIVATIGPASSSATILRQLVLSGVNVARLNFSHGTREGHKKLITDIRKISLELDKPVAILQDLTGPRIRIGNLKDNRVFLKNGAVFKLTTEDILGDAKRISVNYKYLPRDVKEGDTILIADGSVKVEVIGKSKTEISCKVRGGGFVSSKKGINLPFTKLKIPSLTAKDIKDLELGIKCNVDFIALSFVRSGADIKNAKEIIRKNGASIPVIAKIEKPEAVKNIDEIIECSDGLMVARGDLGVEIPLEEIPRTQKMIIRKANLKGKPVITATQMLRSMVENPEPTRAEVTDIANSVLDGTDAMMLSEETAVGRYPVRAVRIMSRIAEKTEDYLPEKGFFYEKAADEKKTIPDAISQAACFAAFDLGAKVIITPTQSGYSAMQVSRFRPRQPIIAVSPEIKTTRKLSLCWGVYPLLVDYFRNTDDMINKAKKVSLASGLVRKGDTVVMTAGLPVGKSGTTNLVKAFII
ncbi:MAG: pyruvate kinase [Candidatus Schekmanbacteria bacterium RBG_16_38_11]|uniref:Pyruvate kinase n=1 Tax=Candidatus Schekmanbacteria bacterium RBG_16_38_11 TaxID=1817880 RepID=A0A1F7RSE3_9BACT|nr:MAG: pyruvate kinase [Candidatus Schekmanbacteria bacterium RBG_16_38_11]